DVPEQLVGRADADLRELRGRLRADAGEGAQSVGLARRDSSAPTSSSDTPRSASSTSAWYSRSAVSQTSSPRSAFFAAMTTSVASSPIFLPMWSTPPANSLAVYEPSTGFALRDWIVRASADTAVAKPAPSGAS